jgi:hypothetical protein
LISAEPDRPHVIQGRHRPPLDGTEDHDVVRTRKIGCPFRARDRPHQGHWASDRVDSRLADLAIDRHHLADGFQDANGYARIADVAALQPLGDLALELHGSLADNAQLARQRKGNSPVGVCLYLPAQLRQAEHVDRDPVERPHEMRVLTARHILQRRCR